MIMEKRKITGAVFDMDGTLVDSMKIWSVAGDKYLKEQGIKADDYLGEVLFSMTMEEGAEYMIEQYELDKSREDVIAGINRIVYDFYAEEVELKEGVYEALSKFESAGIPMAVATSTDRELAERALSRTGIDKFFKGIFTCSEIGLSKNHPDIYIAACELLGTERENTWVFEDGLYGLVTAKAAGFKVVGIYDEVSRHDREKLKKESDIYFEGPIEAGLFTGM